MQFGDSLAVGMSDESTKQEEEEQDKYVQTKDRHQMKLLFTADENPPWHLCLGLAMQHFLTFFGSTAPIPIVLANKLGIPAEDPANADIMSTLIFVSGIVTLMQVTLGIRLPIVQGGTVTLIIPALALINMSKMKCEKHVQEGLCNQTASSRRDSEAWKVQMTEIQGALMIASIFEVVVGFTGLIGCLLRYVSPLVTSPAIALVGIALYREAAEFAGENWAISVLTVITMVVFSEILSPVKCPCGIACSAEAGVKCRRVPIFRLFPVLLAVVCMWLLCAVLTAFDVLPPDNKARTDLQLDVLSNSRWFRVPLPGQWGMPTVNWAGVVGMVSGVFATLLETIGNYYACAQASGSPPPPNHAINRGIFVEGIGSFLGGLWGTGDGSSTYSENIGVVSMTKVGSRRVIVTLAIIMIVVGANPKFGALFFMVPRPLIGAMFIVLFSTIISIGFASLEFVDLNSSRNFIVLGLPFCTALFLPDWLEDHQGIINTGSPSLDSAVTIMLSTNVFVGGALALLLDNLIPGTPEERGMAVWVECQQYLEREVNLEAPPTFYEFPHGMKLLTTKLRWLRFLPISPSFRGGHQLPRWCCCQFAMRVSGSDHHERMESHVKQEENKNVDN